MKNQIKNKQKIFLFFLLTSIFFSLYPTNNAIYLANNPTDLQKLKMSFLENKTKHTNTRIANLKSKKNFKDLKKLGESILRLIYIVGIPTLVYFKYNDIKTFWKKKKEEVIKKNLVIKKKENNIDRLTKEEVQKKIGSAGNNFFTYFEQNVLSSLKNKQNPDPFIYIYGDPKFNKSLFISFINNFIEEYNEKNQTKIIPYDFDFLQLETLAPVDSSKNEYLKDTLSSCLGLIEFKKLLEKIKINSNSPLFIFGEYSFILNTLKDNITNPINRETLEKSQKDFEEFLDWCRDNQIYIIITNDYPGEFNINKIKKIEIRD